jgi:hypothetical protein
MMPVPPEIDYLHRALLAALRVDHFRPGMGDVNAWRDFLFVLDSLKDSDGGELTPRDVHAAVDLMRQQNKAGESKWSLRFSKILREPESFRDLVLISRKRIRPRPAIQTVSRKTGDGANVMDERDPAVANDPKPIADELRKWREQNL